MSFKNVQDLLCKQKNVFWKIYVFNRFNKINNNNNNKNKNNFFYNK